MAYTETAVFASSASYSAVAVWVASHGYLVGNIVRNVAPSTGNERCFVCIVAGTSLGTEPAWAVSKGFKTVESGGPTWQECTALPAVNGDVGNTPAWAANKGSISLGVIIKNV